ncbi:hypothetical protein J4558_18450 [Leptolyngbya sp. 15MV]|nr:hypothetical protein J4558_18450 [Leptolyngbya sp. 15MV]
MPRIAVDEPALRRSRIRSVLAASDSRAIERIEGFPHSRVSTTWLSTVATATISPATTGGRTDRRPEAAQP